MGFCNEAPRSRAARYQKEFSFNPDAEHRGILLIKKELSRKTGSNESITILIVAGRYLPIQNQKALISKAVGERQDELFENQ